MHIKHPTWPTVQRHLREASPAQPVLYFHAQALRHQLQQFQNGFIGKVTYAVKANSDRRILETLLAGNIAGFDVASGAEIQAVRMLHQTIPLHYNNPVRSIDEIKIAVAHHVASYAVDSLSELKKLLAHVPKGKEISVRITRKEQASLCDFGSKFGTSPDEAVKLLQMIARAGYAPAITFHVGTQCHDPSAFARYLHDSAQIVARSGVQLSRINVGGGFPAMMNSSDQFVLEEYFSEITRCVKKYNLFPDNNFAERVVCEPGRALVSPCMDAAVQVKAVRDGRDVFLNDGVYGLLAEWREFGNRDRLQVHHGETDQNTNKNTDQRAFKEFRIFGPTCDSLDVLNTPLLLPKSLQEGDYLIIRGMGAYTTATQTAFNGYGQAKIVHVLSLTE